MARFSEAMLRIGSRKVRFWSLPVLVLLTLALTGVQNEGVRVQAQTSPALPPPGGGVAEWYNDGTYYFQVTYSNAYPFSGDVDRCGVPNPQGSPVYRIRLYSSASIGNACNNPALFIDVTQEFANNSYTATEVQAIFARFRGAGGVNPSLGKPPAAVNTRVPKWYQAGIPNNPPGCYRDPQTGNPVNCPAGFDPYPGNLWGAEGVRYDGKDLPAGTIKAFGCALTVFTVVANFCAGNTQDPTDASGLTPQVINDTWPGVYDGGSVQWSNYASASKSAPNSFVRYYAARECPPPPATCPVDNNAFPFFSGVDSRVTLDSILRNNVPVVLQIFVDQVRVELDPATGQPKLDAQGKQIPILDSNGNKIPLVDSLGNRVPAVDPSGKPLVRHFVVVTGRTPTGDYYVNDPGDVNTKTLSDLDKAVWMHPENILDRNLSLDPRNYIVFGCKDTTGNYPVLLPKDPSTAQALGVYSSDPVTFVLTDPLGRRTGFDPVSKASLQEIPTSAYSVIVYSDDVNLSAPDPPPFKALDMANQMAGQYTLDVIGTGSGGFTVKILRSDAAGNWIIQTYSGTTAPGAASRFYFQGAVTTFATFSATVAISQSTKGFGVAGLLSVGAGFPSFDPLTQPVTLKVGAFVITIPAGSFQLDPSGSYVFTGIINGVQLAAGIQPQGGTLYAYGIAGQNAGTLPTANPVDVRLAVGSAGGNSAVTATFVP